MTKEQAIAAAKEIDEKYLSPESGVISKGNGAERHHLRWMVWTMSVGMSEDKVMRWLGFIQGVLVGGYGVPLEEMKALNDRHSQS